jgi:tol-pal system protein YbgF
MRTYMSSIWIVILLVTGALIFSLSCAGTQNDALIIDDTESADQINDNSQDTADASSDEAEVLSLLGISPKSDSSSASSTSTSVANEASGTSIETKPAVNGTSDLQTKVKSLEDESQRKSQEVVDLRTELAERDRRISDLQKELLKSDKASRAVASDASTSFKNKYDQALMLYNDRKYRQAIQLFDDLLNQGASNSLVDNCQYWKGECYYGLSDYNQAIIEFQKIFAFDKSNKFDDAQLKLGLCYLSIGNKEKAKKEFEKLLFDYPDSEFVNKAKSYLAGL